MRVFAWKVCAKFGAVAVEAIPNTLVCLRMDVAAKILLSEGTIQARRDLCRFCDPRVCECLICFQAATSMSATCQSRRHCKSCFCNRRKVEQRCSSSTIVHQFAPHKKMTQLPAKFRVFSYCNRSKEHGWAAD
ncbi:protein of unknown function [Bradyrhizobium vignae]|uniref:Uncharacterized protein n=1 Tax=Bradyrhizobium vignae TaxID=1549949 RepID=A0A2U3Q838_9BRAD|nr:protein of unknown function [Bradyrhizobium vignae]